MQSWRVLKNTEPNPIFCTRGIRSSADNGNGGKYISLVWEPSLPSAPSLCPWLIYFPDHVSPAQSEFIFPFTLTLEVNLRPCFLAEDKNTFPIWKPLHIIHSYHNRYSLWYSIVDIILTAKFYQPPKKTRIDKKSDIFPGKHIHQSYSKAVWFTFS